MIYDFFYNWFNGFLSPLLSFILGWVAVFIIGVLITLNIPIILGWVDRKLSARIQSRYGPTYNGPFGLLQNIADVIKLMGKRFITNRNVDTLVLNIVPVALSLLAFIMVFIIPWGNPNLILVSVPFNLLFIYIAMALSPLFVLLAGWSQNNKYAMLGGFRGAAQITTYELSLLLIFVGVGMLSGSYNITTIVNAQSHIWYIMYLPIMFIVFLLSSLAITERAPFDLPEATQELQAGWKIEYPGIRYGLFFIAEYVRLAIAAMLLVYLFFGGWNGPVLPDYIWFWAKTAVVTFVLMSLRWVFNRPRMDQLIKIGFNWLLPLSVINLLIVGAVLFY
ncbi:MAG: NADH-quinone oxidoreductase subunit H [Candidatus Parvarchaeota archaeon]|jgi:NADH-quinone oxidoreductase subunit H|nr:NADH-quinone oxidoreductase subunit H [Candidatus Parvarchaeota archaeon]